VAKMRMRYDIFHYIMSALNEYAGFPEIRAFDEPHHSI
jgi:hypothetical protein